MSRRKPNPRDSLPTEAELLFQALTQEEFKLVYAVDWLARSDDYGVHFPLANFATPGKPADGDGTVAEDFKRVIRWLNFEHGVEFEGVEPWQDGAIAGTIVCPANLKYFEMLATGMPPDYLSALTTAIQVLEERAPGMNLEIFRAALSDLRLTIATRPKGDPEAEVQADRFADAALAAVGVVRGNRAIN